jgi:glutamyl-tRNA synthetase
MFWLSNSYKKLRDEGVECSEEKAATICGLLKERVTFPHEFWTAGQYFFFAPTEYDDKVIRKKWSDEAATVFADYRDALKNVDTLTPELALETLNGVLEKLGIGMGKVMQVLRVVMTGQAGGPDLMGIIAVLGKDEVIRRIDRALEKLQ